MGILVTTKAHMIEDRVFDQTRDLCGIGDKEEHHIEKHYQNFSQELEVTIRTSRHRCSQETTRSANMQMLLHNIKTLVQEQREKN